MKARYLWIPALLYVGMVVVRGGLAPRGGDGLSPSTWVATAPAAAGHVPTPQGYVAAGVVAAKVTAYEPSAVSCGDSADGLTAIGRDAHRPDGVAVAPEAIPYGSLVFIPGVGFRQVDDTGAAMVNAWRRKRLVHIDVRMKTVPEALAWGVRHEVPVHVFLRER